MMAGKAKKQAARRRQSNFGHPEPPVVHQEPPVEVVSEVKAGPHDRRFWPASEPMPDVWYKLRQRFVPCPKCRRLLRDNGSQAAVCTASGSGVAFFRCRECGHRWQLPVRAI